MKRKSSSSYNASGQPKKYIERFKVSPIKQFFGNKHPYFRQPIEFGFFSLDGTRTFHNDNSLLRYYNPPKNTNLNFDLRKGYDTSIRKDEDVKERLNHLLSWIHCNKKKFQSSDQQSTGTYSSRLNTDFVSWRGHFTKFLLTPYEQRDPWKMCVTLFNGTIFISEIETEKSKQERINRSQKHEEMCYWGYKFEDYVTESIHENFNKSDIVNTNEAFCSIVRTRLQNNSILIGAEVDCCDKRNNKPPSNYVELKTSRLMYNDKQKSNFARNKLKKIWAQSFLAGVPKVVVGLRDDNGIVKELNSFNTLEIPRAAKQYGDFWNANLCLTFLDRFLNWLKELVQIDDPNVGYILTFDEPFSEIIVKVVLDGSERFLPSWFTDGKTI